MRTLFVTNHKHLPELRGGMEVNTHELATGLLRRGASPGVLCGLAGVGYIGMRARARMKLLGEPCPRDLAMGYPTWRSWDVVEHVGRVAAEFRPEVAVVQGGDRFTALVEACLGLEIPVFCYLHTNDRLPLDSASLTNPKLHFLANSHFTTSLHPEKRFAAVIRPIVRAAPFRTETDRSSAVFINPGPHKGLAIVMALAEARRDVPFLFVRNRKGVDPAAVLGGDPVCHPNIRLVGPFDDMRQVYARAKLVLAPSQWLETWGRIATEAHLSGIPVLASDRGGLPEAVGPGGVCLPADAPMTAWIAAFSRIWDDGRYYAKLCEAARAWARRPEIDSETILSLFTEQLAAGVRHAA